MEKEKSYVGYEYKNVTTRKEMESVITDGYKNFGWELEKSAPTVVKHIRGPIRVMLAPLALLPGTPFGKMIQDHKSDTKVDINLKRDKAITSKNELNQLQIQFEKIINDIVCMEESKTTRANAAAYIVGMAGTVFMGLSTFSYLADNVQGCIILAVPGFLGWLLSAVVYKVIKEKRCKIIMPKIEEKYEDVTQICEKAYALI
jgi:hypothetical protein